jgi:ABC-type branched-subunit amino acid transport system substrate-binding protein
MVRTFFQLVIVLVACFSFDAAASKSAEELFAKGVKTLETGDTQKAEVIFSEIVKKHFRKNSGEHALALLIEVHLAKGVAIAENMENAERYIEKYETYYAKGTYHDRVMIAKAFIKIQKGDFYGAMQDLGLVLKTSNNPVQLSRAKQSINKILDARVLTVSELNNAFDKFAVDSDVAGWLMLNLAKESVKSKRYKQARYYSSRLLAEQLLPAKQEEIQGILNQSKKSTGGIATVLVLGPLTGPYAEFGNELIQGVLVAYEQSNMKAKVEIRFLDTEGEPVTAVNKTRQVMQRDSVVGIVGPILSSTASALAVWLSSAYPHVPMITPTANEDGIAGLGNNIFQINVPAGQLATSIADYAMNCLAIPEFALLSPNSAYGVKMANFFIETVQKNGGTVLASEFYEEGGKDYQTQFNILRNSKYTLDQKRKRIANGTEDINYIHPRHKAKFLADSVIHFKGFFLPASDPEDAALLASQYTYSKMDGVLLGSSGWYGRSVLTGGKSSVEGAYFSTPFLETTERKQWLDFRGRFFGKWNANPEADKVSGLSFDALNILYNALDGSKSVVQSLRALRQYEGVYGTIQFHPELGSNTKVHIVTIENGKFSMANACNTANP